MSLEDAYLSAYGPPQNEGVRTLLPPESVDISRFEGPDARAVREFIDYVREQFDSKELVGAYLHGSLGVYDYVTGYSDFDALLIVRASACESPEGFDRLSQKIAQANVFLYLFDPLQHHNLFILTEYDLSWFSEPVFPLVLFRYAKEITEFRNTLTFQCFPIGSNGIAALSAWTPVFKKWMNQHNISAFRIKHIVQSIVFLPVLYLQAKTGEYMFKKYVFSAARDDFEAEQWLVVEEASELRKSWRYRSLYPYALRKWIGIHFGFAALHVLSRVWDRQYFIQLRQVTRHDFAKRGYRLLENMLEAVRSA